MHSFWATLYNHDSRWKVVIQINPENNITNSMYNFFNGIELNYILDLFIPGHVEINHGIDNILSPLERTN